MLLFSTSKILMSEQQGEQKSQTPGLRGD